LQQTIQPAYNRPMNRRTPARPIAIAALFCVLAALFVLVTTLPEGGIPPEFVLFVVLAAVFGALWWTLR
jgi:hypothetical protein